MNLPDLHVDVVIGVQHPYREKIEAACVQRGFVCYIQTDKMAELMAIADLAIGAGGSASWERCCLGLPTLAICTANNQQKQVADAARDGLLYAPEVKGDLNQTVQRHTTALIENGHLRQHLSCNSMQAVDGWGVLRIIAKMGISNIDIRLARLDDSEKMFQWRNHPSVREISRNANVIDWQNHQKWFAAALADSNKILLIGQYSECPVGVVRFDVRNDEAEISIYLAPDKVSSGLGRSLLQTAEQWLVANHPYIRKICAHVLGANQCSQKLFIGAGYLVESTDYSKRLH